MELNRGVFLDLGSVDNGDLNRGQLSRSLPQWQWHDLTLPAECPDRIAGADVVISNKCVLDRAALSAASELKLIVAAATGTNHIDLVAAQDLDISVCNSRD